MSREQDIKLFLSEVAPIFRRASRRGQIGAAELAATDLARRYLRRQASSNQTFGTGRWRIVGDTLVYDEHAALLRHGVEVSSRDAEQNRGLYYFSAPKQGLLFTVKQQPHDEDDQPRALQERMGQMLLDAEAVFEGEVVKVYLVVPRVGEPSFEVVAKGEPIVYELGALIREAAHATARAAEETASAQAPQIDEAQRGAVVTPFPPRSDGAIVRSSRGAPAQADRPEEEDQPRG